MRRSDVLELRLDVGGLGVERRDPLAGARPRRPAASATSGPSGAAPPRIASPTCFETALRSALRASASPRSAPAAGVELQGDVDERGVLALVERALADDVRLLAEPLQPDAHAPASRSLRRRIVASADIAGACSQPRRPAGERRSRGSRLARSQPARGPFVAAQEGEVDGAERAAGRERRLLRRRGRGAPARRRRPAGRSFSAAIARPPRKTRWSSPRAAASVGRASRRTRTTALSGA